MPVLGELPVLSGQWSRWPARGASEDASHGMGQTSFRTSALFASYSCVLTGPSWNCASSFLGPSASRSTAEPAYCTAGGERLIVNSPHEEPAWHWRYDRTAHLFDLADGHRPAGYSAALAREFECRWFLLCQLEWAKTLIPLTEAPPVDWLHLDIPSDGDAFKRLGAKMATGSGNTAVVAKVITGQVLNRVTNSRDARSPRKSLWSRPASRCGVSDEFNPTRFGARASHSPMIQSALVVRSRRIALREPTLPVVR